MAQIALKIVERMVEKKLELKAAMMRVFELEGEGDMQRHRSMMRNYFDVFFK